ncbi:hypothetical protein [Saccharopolyspora hattusasensis]|uniref:hypothetical protein n=1 Tax=Saccharopolyspora hattusasensis TaxID=1128679 RepID=UPI003D98A7FF
MTFPLRWPDGTPVGPGPDNAPTPEEHIRLSNESIIWTRINPQLKDRILQRLRAL